MFGRLSQYRSIHDFVDTLDMPNAVVNAIGEQPLGRYNLPPTESAALIHQVGETLQVQDVRWGWRPDWATGSRLVAYALAENVASMTFWRQIWPCRAIVPIDGWFEWLPDPDDPKHEQPYMIRRKDKAPILCAAIGEFPHACEGPRANDGFVILTSRSQALTGAHDRSLVVLDAEQASEWLDPATSPQRAEQMLRQVGADGDPLEWFKVSKRVKYGDNGPKLIEPLPDDPDATHEQE
ncbi:putative SOS response-associated peptidase YedK [compost metagenome]